MKFLGIIPARYASTRFPGKPLIDIMGKPMIQHVYENTAKAIEHVYVATDDQRIFNTVTSFGGKAIMTNTNHQSGTDRCYEAATLIGKETGLVFDVIVNVQGDEPFLDPKQIKQLMKCFTPKTELATLVSKLENIEQLTDPSTAKVVLDSNNNGILFSRSPIPFVRGVATEDWLTKHQYYRHIGMYAYRADILAEVTQLSPSSLELAESLEQLRWIENGYKIQCGFTDIQGVGIDTPQDLEEMLKSFKK